MSLSHTSTLKAWLQTGAVAPLPMLAVPSVRAEPNIVCVGVPKCGTIAWELNTLNEAAMDEVNGGDVELQPFAGDL